MIDRTFRGGDMIQHFKGGLYRFLYFAINASNNADGEKMAVYEALNVPKTFVRNYDEFISEVDHEKYPEVKQKYRFEKISLSSDGTPYTGEWEVNE